MFKVRSPRARGDRSLRRQRFQLAGELGVRLHRARPAHVVRLVDPGLARGGVEADRLDAGLFLARGVVTTFAPRLAKKSRYTGVMRILRPVRSAFSIFLFRYRWNGWFSTMRAR